MLLCRRFDLARSVTCWLWLLLPCITQILGDNAQFLTRRPKASGHGSHLEQAGAQRSSLVNNEPKTFQFKLNDTDAVVFERAKKYQKLITNLRKVFLADGQLLSAASVTQDLFDTADLDKDKKLQMHEVEDIYASTGLVFRRLGVTFEDADLDHSYCLAPCEFMLFMQAYFTMKQKMFAEEAEGNYDPFYIREKLLDKFNEKGEHLDDVRDLVDEMYEHYDALDTVEGVSFVSLKKLYFDFGIEEIYKGGVASDMLNYDHSQSGGLDQSEFFEFVEHEFLKTVHDVLKKYGMFENNPIKMSADSADASTSPSALQQVDRSSLLDGGTQRLKRARAASMAEDSLVDRGSADESPVDQEGYVDGVDDDDASEDDAADDTQLNDQYTTDAELDDTDSVSDEEQTEESSDEDVGDDTVDDTSPKQQQPAGGAASARKHLRRKRRSFNKKEAEDENKPVDATASSPNWLPEYDDDDDEQPTEKPKQVKAPCPTCLERLCPRCGGLDAASLQRLILLARLLSKKLNVPDGVHIALQSATDQRTFLLNLFRFYDVDRSRYVDLPELQGFYKDLNIELMWEQDAPARLMNADKDKSGDLNPEEFFDFMDGFMKSLISRSTR